MSTKNVSKSKKVVAPAIVAAAVPLTAPAKTPNAFSAFVAAQKKATEVAAKATEKAVVRTSTPDVGVAVQLAAKEGFQHTEQNGRKDYTPHTIGRLIWDTASALQAITPNTPVTSAAVRIALPHVKARSVSAGLSHWRKFCGKTRTKGVAVSAPSAAPAAAAAEHMGPPEPPWGRGAALM